MMKEKMEELKAERVQAQQLREEQLQQLTRQMDRHRASTEEEMKGQMERLEQRGQLRINEQVKRISASVKEAEERIQG